MLSLPVFKALRKIGLRLIITGIAFIIGIFPVNYYLGSVWEGAFIGAGLALLTAGAIFCFPLGITT